MPLRLLVVVALVAAFALARWLHRRWRRRAASDDRPLPRLPAQLVGGAERTWVVFTTPYCASCGPAADGLRRRDPGARVVTVDAASRPDLAGAFFVRNAPTALLAGADGEVRARLVGAAAVLDYVGTPAAQDYVRSPQ